MVIKIAITDNTITFVPKAAVATVPKEMTTISADKIKAIINQNSIISIARTKKFIINYGLAYFEFINLFNNMKIYLKLLII